MWLPTTSFLDRLTRSLAMVYMPVSVLQLAARLAGILARQESRTLFGDHQLHFRMLIHPRFQEILAILGAYAAAG